MRFLAALALASCSTPQPMIVDDAAPEALAPVGGARPLATLRTPENWDQKTPLPLLLVLHGYGAGGLAQAIYFGVLPLVDEKQIILAAPDGLFDKKNRRYWNAVDTCCDFDRTNVDDVLYLTKLVDEIATRHPIDRKRVWVIGHSNGGAMSLRLACDRTATFAAALELAGPFWSDPQTSCKPSMPIAIRVVHGTADEQVPYDGGASPGALAIASFFAQKNNCMGPPDTSAPPLDLDSTIAGAETLVTRFPGCDVELWSIEGGTHIPALGPGFRGIVWDFFSARSR